MGILEQIHQQIQEQAELIMKLTARVGELERNLDEDIKGTLAAAKFAGVSPRTLEIERDRPGTLIIYKKDGRSVSYSRKSLLEYKAKRRISIH